MNLTMKISGEYRMVVSRPGETTRDTGWFSNIITNTGLDAMGAAGTPVTSFTVCSVGTGTSTPSATQTSLDARVAYKVSGLDPTSVNQGAAGNYDGIATYTYAFTTGDVVGNISEVGIGSGTGIAAQDLASRALIVDSGGAPTTITLTAIDQLTVYYRVRWVCPRGDTTGTVVIGGVSYGYTVRPANITTFQSDKWGGIGPCKFGNSLAISNYKAYAAGTALAAETGGPVGSNTSCTSTTRATYIPGTYYVDMTSTWGTSAGNLVGGIQLLLVATDTTGRQQIRFDTPIPKDNTKVFTFTCRISWARA